MASVMQSFVPHDMSHGPAQSGALQDVHGCRPSPPTGCNNTPFTIGLWEVNFAKTTVSKIIFALDLFHLAM
jgi:hypothetical protein